MFHFVKNKLKQIKQFYNNCFLKSTEICMETRALAPTKWDHYVGSYLRISIGVFGSVLLELAITAFLLPLRHLHTYAALIGVPIMWVVPKVTFMIADVLSCSYILSRVKSTSIGKELRKLFSISTSPIAINNELIRNLEQGSLEFFTNIEVLSHNDNGAIQEKRRIMTRILSGGIAYLGDAGDVVMEEIGQNNISVQARTTLQANSSRISNILYFFEGKSERCLKDLSRVQILQDQLSPYFPKDILPFIISYTQDNLSSGVINLGEEYNESSTDISEIEKEIYGLRSEEAYLNSLSVIKKRM